MTLLGAGAVGTVAVVTATLAGLRRAGSRSPAVSGGAVSAAGEPSQPVVLIPREQWGAREPDVSPDGRGERGPYSPANPNGWLVYDRPLEEVLERIIIHHSALPLTDGPVEIQRLHMEERGFADIGYQYLIDEAGRLFEGRPLNVRGAHTAGSNTGSVGICLLGNFEETQPTAAQLNSLHALIKALLLNFKNITSLAGHKDFNPDTTLCPGQHLYALLAEIAGQHGLRYGV